MIFRTVLVPSRQRFHVRAQHGGHGMYFNNFEYELTEDPTAEAVSVEFGPELVRTVPREMWPDIETGSRFGAAEALASGTRLCCVHFTMLFAHYHDVDSTSRAIQTRVAWCVHEYIAPRFTQPVPPLQPEWLTSDVVALARGIRAAGHSAGVPILTDALLEAGCDDPLVIEHLRTCTDHGPCCWVAEMVCAQAEGR